MLWFAWRGNKRSRDRNFVVAVSQLCHFLGSFGRAGTGPLAAILVALERTFRANEADVRSSGSVILALPGQALGQIGALRLSCRLGRL
jgi:hypothetical protein